MRILLLALILLLSSCTSSRQIVTDGSSKGLPQPSARLAVWGQRPVVTNSVVAWLRESGFAVMEPVELQQVFDREKIRVSRSFADERNAVRVAKELEVDFIIFTQSAVETTVINRDSTTAAITPYSGAVRTAFSSASVALRGIEVATGRLMFSATAKYPQQLTPAGPDTLSILSCQALETAWGLIPSGRQELSPDAAC